MTRRPEPTSDCDALVVGGGPAGSAAAIVLARAGVRVALIDARTFPRDKTCGDLVGTDAVATLRKLGLTDVLEAGFALEGARVYGPSGQGAGVRSRTSPDLSHAARVIPREVFDARLVAAAIDAGAVLACERVRTLVRTGADAFTLETSLGTRYARAVIGADGYGSRVAAAIGRLPARDKHLAVVVRAYAEGVRDIGTAMHFYVNAPEDGYGWVFPLGNGRANVGLGFVLGDRPRRPDVHAAFARFVRSDGPAAEFLATARLSSTSAWPIPLGWANGPVASRGVFLAGDATALASPLSGSGIHNALRSGMLAAEATLRHLKGDAHAHERYARELRERFAPRLRAESAARAIAGTANRVAPYLALARALPFGEELLSRSLLALG